jgi:hypothetical protein
MSSLASLEGHGLRGRLQHSSPGRGVNGLFVIHCCSQVACGRVEIASALVVGETPVHPALSQLYEHVGVEGELPEDVRGKVGVGVVEDIAIGAESRCRWKFDVDGQVDQELTRMDVPEPERPKGLMWRECPRR